MVTLDEGNLVACVWTGLGSIDISIKKAFTSRTFDIATNDLASHCQSGEQFFRIHAFNDGRIMIFAGGIPSSEMESSWRRRCEWWLGRARPCRGGSRGCGFLNMD
jgi:hypothetical protein